MLISIFLCLLGHLCQCFIDTGHRASSLDTCRCQDLTSSEAYIALTHYLYAVLQLLISHLKLRIFCQQFFVATFQLILTGQQLLITESKLLIGLFQLEIAILELLSPPAQLPVIILQLNKIIFCFIKCRICGLLFGL